MDDNEDILEMIPALCIFKGFPVIKKKDTYETLKNEEGENQDLNDFIKKLSTDYKTILLTDINGVNRDKPQLDIVKSVSTKMELWVDAGTRIGPGVIDVFVAGADYVVLGTKTLLDLDELEKANELSENVILDINYDEGIVSPKKNIRDMDPFDLAKEAKNIGIKNLIFTDLKNTAGNSDFDENSAKRVISEDLNVYFHGRFNEDHRHFSKIGIKGLVNEVDTLL
jgi:uncharacterized protein related to proFAR isomerase